MTIEDLLSAFNGSSVVRVVSRSGHQYDVEWDVVAARSCDPDPYVYGWPIVPVGHRDHKRPRWFFVRNMELATGTQWRVTRCAPTP